MKEVILNRLDDSTKSNPGGLIDGYSAMARDAAREREAEEWSEGLIGDSSAVDPCATSPAPARRTLTYFASARSSENAPAPRNNSVPAMASASRWNSMPSPFWLPIQFMKKPFGR